MKQYFHLILFVLISVNCFGQTLFFDNLNLSSWTSTSIKSELQLSNSTEINLTTLKISKDSLKKNVSIWTFKDSVLTITNYDTNLKRDSLIGKYNFKSANSILEVKLNDISQLNFKVGIISTGSFATLYRSFEKKANFTANVDIGNTTKDGLYLNRYVVNIPYDKIEKLNGKTVNISGDVTIVKPSNLDRNGKLQQGRNTITKHILNPKIKIVE